MREGVYRRPVELYSLHGKRSRTVSPGSSVLSGSSGDSSESYNIAATRYRWLKLGELLRNGQDQDSSLLMTYYFKDKLLSSERIVIQDCDGFLIVKRFFRHAGSSRRKLADATKIT